MAEYYARDGRPIDQDEWLREWQGENKRVARTEVGDASVSTVYLGLNHQWHPDGPPLIFETMIFGGDYDEHQWRWSSEQQALDAHERIVVALREGHDPDAEPCGRLLVGQGGDTWDPVCVLPKGHAGSCRPSAPLNQ